MHAAIRAAIRSIERTTPTEAADENICPLIFFSVYDTHFHLRVKL
jgi:hypothetical protein